MNEKSFYDSVRADLFNRRITIKQLEGLQAILAEYKQMALTDWRFLAYVLATVYHETARTMQPIEEHGKGAACKYGRKLKMNGQPYTDPDRLYYGRGLVQLTWFENYSYFSKVTKLDLLHKPELVLEMPISIKILFHGMLKGSFTGKKLSDYITPAKTDFKNCRRIINGTDKADLIAGYADKFYHAIILK